MLPACARVLVVDGRRAMLPVLTTELLRRRGVSVWERYDEHALDWGHPRLCDAHRLGNQPLRVILRVLV